MDRPLKCDCTAAERIALVKTLDLNRLHECLAYHNEYPNYFQPSVLKAINARIVRLEKQENIPSLTFRFAQRIDGSVHMTVDFHPNISILSKKRKPTQLGNTFVKVMDALGVSEDEILKSVKDSITNAR